MSLPQASDWFEIAFWCLTCTLVWFLSQATLCLEGTASTCWLPTSWSPRRAMTTWPPLPTSPRSPPQEPTWTCAPLTISPSPWMRWCTTSTLTMRRWRLPTRPSCLTVTSLTAVAWCALSWLWLLETTRVTCPLLGFAPCLCLFAPFSWFECSYLWDSLKLHHNTTTHCRIRVKTLYQRIYRCIPQDSDRKSSA